MRDMKEDVLKSESRIVSSEGKVCKVEGCLEHITNYRGPGANSVCRHHQTNLREYGGMGRLDRLWTFHRKWICSCCNTNILDDPRLADIDDEMIKRRVGRVLMHADHTERRADGGSHHQDNVKSLCTICHAKKTILQKDYIKK